MADAVVHIGENSPEEVALKLLRIIAQNEKKTLVSSASEGAATADRQWILSTYAECVTTVRAGHYANK